MKSSNANGVWVSYTYDDMGRLGTVVDNRLSGSNTTTYSYDAASNLETAAYPNNSISAPSTFTYDSLNRLTALASPVSSYNYTLGATGNRTKATEQGGRTLNWSYDGIYRLTNETISADPANKDGVVTYTLDSVGNRKTIASSLSGVNSGGTFSYTPDDELSTDMYDNNGDTTHSGANSFTYDSENHLMAMNSGAVTLLYDGDGNRVAKTVNGVTTRYLVDDLNPTGLPQVVDELVGGAVTRQYSYGLDRISENQFVSGAWTASFYGVDGGGSVRQLTNSTGTVTDTYEYDAFGNKVNSTGTTPNNYLYRGEQHDPDLGLYYLRARYYNQVTGRFLNVDSLAGDGQRRYEYAGANPVDGSDPSGNFVLASYWPLMAPLTIHLPWPSWCGSGGAVRWATVCLHARSLIGQ
jgi:RHS repeat-associated protein